MIIIDSIAKHLSILGSFWQDKVNGQLFRLNVFLISFQFLWLILRFDHLPNFVPLFYSLPWGDTRLATASSLFLIPLGSIIITLVNNLLAAYLLRQMSLLSRLLLIFSLILSLLGFMALYQIINLVA